MSSLPNAKPNKSPRKFYDQKEGKFCVYETFSRPKKTIYYIQGGSAKYLDKITLDGYEGLPSGLYLNRNGYGFGKKGVFLLSELKSSFGINKKFDLTISIKEGKSVKTKGNQVSIILPYQDVRNLLMKMSRINQDGNRELKSAVTSFLSTKFPKQVTSSLDNFDDYQSGEIAALLRRKKVLNKLNLEDLESLKSFFPKIFESSLKKGRALKSQRYALLQSTKTTTDKVFLDEVIKEFEKNLNQNLSEEKWQKFLQEKVFRFLANYVTSIEKQNVSLAISYPDFVLVDIYGFVDIYEIKRANTELLAFDESHDNYYWKPDVVKAVSQIENYIDGIIHNSSDYIKEVKRKKNVDIKVVRPRGYIIAGTSKQFKTPKEFEDFRKLGCSLKNVDFLLYDELLENMKNLRSKL